MFRQIQIPYRQIYQGHLILVNQKHPLMTTVDQLVPVSSFDFYECYKEPIYLEQTCKTQLTELLRTAGLNGKFIAVSGYRTEQEQTTIYKSSLLENGQEFTEKYVALPMESEHQTGLAIDLSELTSDVDFIRPSFPQSGMCEYFRQTAPSFGFIERYKQNKQHITGISAEPWHFRYIGIPHAQIATENGICLEEYIDYLQQFRFSKQHLFFDAIQGIYEIYYIQGSEDFTTLSIPEHDNFTFSGNNRDGFIVTAFHEKQQPGGSNE